MFQHEAARKVLEEGGWPRDTRLQTDPPEHRDYRALVSGAFSAGRVKALAPFVHEIATALADDLAGASDSNSNSDSGYECEFVSRYAAWLPIRVITRLLGLPAEDASQIKNWSDAWVEPLSSAISEEREIEVAKLGVELQQYLAGWMQRKEEAPANDVLSDLAHACFPNGEPLPMAEKMGISEHLIVGGHETATSALASGVMLLVREPEVERALRADPGRIRNFVEEVLRLESPSQGFFRFALEDAEVAGVPIPKGSMVQLRFAAANRDPEVFPNPDQLDLERANAGAHMAFSQGEHHCIGAPLARLELQTAFRTLLERFEHFEFATNAPLEYIPGLALRTLRALPIRYRYREAN
jgi:cytochrome P450